MSERNCITKFSRGDGLNAPNIRARASIAKLSLACASKLEASNEGLGLNAVVVEPAFAIFAGENYSAMLERPVATVVSDCAHQAAADRLLTAASPRSAFSTDWTAVSPAIGAFAPRTLW
jgi:hypothetical protein